MTGFTVKNSEVGFGKLVIAPSVFVDACTNQMIWWKEGWTKTHLGAKLEDGFVQYSKETEDQNYKLIKMQIKDAVRAIMNKDFIGRKVEEIKTAMAEKLENPIECVQNTCDHLGMNEEDIKSVVNFFSKQGSTESTFDVVQAITFHARNKAHEDKRYELEGKVTDIMGTIKRRFDKEPVLS